MNVLFIAIDTLRADHLGCYGYGRPTSPHLDRLAERGVRFDQFIAPHIPTHPGYTTLFSGKDVFEHHIVAQGGQVEPPASIKFLPEIMQENGYFTVAADNLGRWFTRGYDLYKGYRWGRNTQRPWRKAEAVNRAARGVLKACADQDRPWFAFLHYWDPHTPYLPPAPFHRMFYSGNEKDPANNSAYEMMNNYPAFQYYFAEWMPGITDVEFPRAQYDAEIAYVDTCLTHIFTYLQQMPGGEDTLIAITSDHGEELDEHQMWFDHHGLYETNLRVPLLRHHPDAFSGGKSIDGLTVHQDLAPTILEAAGLKQAIADQQLPGHSLLEAAQSGAEVQARDYTYICECTWMKKRGLRTKQYKFIQSLYDELHKREPFELYDLKKDPAEQHNLAASKPEMVEKLQGEMEKHIQKRLAETGGTDPLEEQHITLTHVGNVNVAVPDNQVLEPEED
jgi:arylsulfatase A-like enzyme